MYIEQMYTGCLAEAAYYIESNGEAAVIDPMRETGPYLEKAKARGARIKYVFETHFHADFVSGHVDLAKKTGAKIVYGPTAETGFNALIAKDGQVFHLGEVQIKVLHTPGHTMESSSYLLLDKAQKPHAVFTGDTLFIGEVGRPDLAVKSDLSKEDLAGLLHDSLHQKLMTLPDEVIVYPGHGAGSACGKNISEERFSTIGHQKQFNYALQPMSKKDFIKTVTEGILPPPQYFPKNAVLNKSGYEDLEEVLKREVRPLPVAAFEAAKKEGALVLDTRDPQVFCKGFIPGAINIGLDGSYAVWAGTLIEDLQQPIVLVTDPGREEEATLRLARVGYTGVRGFLEGGFAAWQKAGKPVDTISSVPAAEFAKIYQKQKPHVLDVRKPTEYESEHVKDAVSYPLDFINAHLKELAPTKTYYLHCRSGYRSMVAASILKRAGYNKVIDVGGGILALAETNIPLTDYACPSTRAKEEVTG